MRLLNTHILVCFSIIYLSAQDAHFYQAYVSPLTLNPAHSGLSDGNFRIMSVYRDQWRPLVDKPFSTFSLSGDSRFKIRESNQGNSDYLGVGLYFMSDKVGRIAFTTNQLGISTAYHKALDQNSNQYLSIGAQIAVNQRNINFENLDFEDEFDGIGSYSDPSGENFPVNNFGFIDFSLGINYQVKPFDKLSLSLGSALYHVSRPLITFFRNTSTTTFTNQENIFRRLQVHMAASYEFRNELSVIPKAIFASQGPHKQFLVGANIKKDIPDLERSFQYGGGIRLVDDLQGLRAESAILSLGIGIKSSVLGLSYEFGIAGLSNGFRNQGSFELSFIYQGEYDNDTFFCPEF